MRRSIFIILLLFVFTITSGVVFSQEKGGGKNKGNRGKEKASTEPKRPFVGDIAPAFKLMSLDTKREVDLEKIKGKKPIALFFGSYT